MDSSNESQRKTRSRRICIRIPPKIKHEKLIRKPAIKRSTTDETPDDDTNDNKPNNPFSPKEHDITEGFGVEFGKSSFPNGGKLKTSSRIEHDKFDDGGKSKKLPRIEHDKFDDGGGHTKSKIGKSKTKISTTPSDKRKVSKHPTINGQSEELSNESEISFENDDDSPKTSSAGHHDEQIRKVQDENVKMEDFHHFEAEEDVENDQEITENSSDDTEAFTENCIGGILKGFNKDIGTLFLKTSSIESDIKEIKRLLKSRPSQNCSFRSLSSQFKENSAFALLPKFSLTKKSHVRKMESDAGENEEYKMQMINKLASYGGRSVSEIMINIFNKLFTLKLKTKYCWRGSSKGKGKAAFKNFTNIIEILWLAVKVHFGNCTEAMIIKEIKNRFNQADKDYDRSMENRNAE